jgi:hypothetical protein
MLKALFKTQNKKHFSETYPNIVTNSVTTNPSNHSVKVEALLFHSFSFFFILKFDIFILTVVIGLHKTHVIILSYVSFLGLQLVLAYFQSPLFPIRSPMFCPLLFLIHEMELQKNHYTYLPFYSCTHSVSIMIWSIIIRKIKFL